MSDANAVSVIHICSAQDVKEPESRRKHRRPKRFKKCFQASRHLTLLANFSPNRLTSKPSFWSFCEILKGSTEKLPLATSVPPRSKPLLKNRIPWPKYLEVHTCSRDDRRTIEKLRINPVQKADAAHFRTEKKIRQRVGMWAWLRPWSSHPLHYLEVFGWTKFLVYLVSRNMRWVFNDLRSPFGFLMRVSFTQSVVRYSRVIPSTSKPALSWFQHCPTILTRSWGPPPHCAPTAFLLKNGRRLRFVIPRIHLYKFLSKAYQSHWLPVAF